MRWVALVIAGCSSSSAPPTTPSNTRAERPPPAIAVVTPDGVSGVYLGMSRSALAAARPRAVADSSDAAGVFGFRAELEERIGDGTIDEITYYVTTVARNSRLYEIIVDYTRAEPAAKVLERYRRLGRTDSGTRDIVF